MSANQASFPIAAMARMLGVSKAGYYRVAATATVRPRHGRRGLAEAHQDGAVPVRDRPTGRLASMPICVGVARGTAASGSPV